MIFQYAMLSDAYSTNASSPGLVEQRRGNTTTTARRGATTNYNNNNAGTTTSTATSSSSYKRSSSPRSSGVLQRSVAMNTTNGNNYGGGEDTKQMYSNNDDADPATTTSTAMTQPADTAATTPKLNLHTHSNSVMTAYEHATGGESHDHRLPHNSNSTGTATSRRRLSPLPPYYDNNNVYDDRNEGEYELADDIYARAGSRGYNHNVARHNFITNNYHDDLLDIMLFIVAGIMFIVLLDQVFQIGISFGQAAASAILVRK